MYGGTTHYMLISHTNSKCIYFVVIQIYNFLLLISEKEKKLNLSYDL